VILENFFAVEVLLFSLWFGFCFFGLRLFLVLFACFLRDVLCCQKAPLMLVNVTFAHVDWFCGKRNFKRRRQLSSYTFFYPR